MTLSALREYTRLKSDEIFYEVEIQRLKKLKKQDVTYYTSPPLDAVPGAGTHSGSATENLALFNVEYAKKIDVQIEKHTAALHAVREQLKAIDDFIAAVDDRETRSMLRRHIKQRVSYNQIAKEHFVSRNYVARRIKEVCK